MEPISGPRVAIIGGGFSGAMTAVNIARLSDDPIHICVVDRHCPIGRGVAYAVRRPEYLLNVAARNMSALADEPDHFVQWLRTRSEYVRLPEAELRELFAPRQVYGDYLSSLVQQRLQNPASLVTAEIIAGEAVDIEPHESTCTVHLADGSLFEADRVVLATGNETPAALPGAESLAGHRSWVANPWSPWEERLPQEDSSIVVLGTGLSAVDVILTLRTVGWGGDIHAVSRHGWFPHAHFRGVEYDEFPPGDIDLTDLELGELQTLIERHCVALEKRGANPAMIVDKLRPYTQGIWRHLSREERLAFVTDHAARWNVLRHRIAPEIHAVLTDAQHTGQLRVHAAGIAKLEPSNDRILVHLNDREPLSGDLVINATGPSTRFTSTQSVLLQNLLAAGLVAPDAMDMGVRVDPDHTVVTADGERSPWLLALGPLLKGTYWESIAVPELRGQARRLAESLLNRVHEEEDAAIFLEYIT